MALSQVHTTVKLPLEYASWRRLSRPSAVPSHAPEALTAGLPVGALTSHGYTKTVVNSSMTRMHETKNLQTQMLGRSADRTIRPGGSWFPKDVSRAAAGSRRTSQGRGCSSSSRGETTVPRGSPQLKAITPAPCHWVIPKLGAHRCCDCGPVVSQGSGA